MLHTKPDPKLILHRVCRAGLPAVGQLGAETPRGTGTLPWSTALTQRDRQRQQHSRKEGHTGPLRALGHLAQGREGVVQAKWEMGVADGRGLDGSESGEGSGSNLWALEAIGTVLDRD